jgi:hypothetical protein
MDCEIINQHFYIVKIHVVIIIVFLILINQAYSAKGDSTNINNDWNQFRNNPQHTGFQAQPGTENITNYGIKWFKDFREGEEYNDLIYGEITVSDINMDGKKELLFGSDNCVVYCLDINGDLIWKYDTKGKVSSTPRLVNINDDDNLEVIVGSDNVYALTSKGDLLWEYNAQGIDASAAIGDINGDGELDIVIGDLENQIYAITKEGELIWQYDTGNWVESSAVLLDIDEDEKQEIIVGNGNGVLYAITTIKEIIFPNVPTLRRVEYNPEILWKFETEQHDNIGFVGSPVLSDINNDNKSEIIFGASDGNLYCLNRNGKELWHYSTNNPIYTTPAIADINNDGKNEIITTSDNKLIVVDCEGNFLWKHEFSMRISSNPAIFDVNEDGYLEITSIDEEWVSLGPGINPEPWINSTNILNHKGEIIHKLTFSEKGYNFGKGISISDLDDDGALEILTGTIRGFVYCYGKVNKSDINNQNGNNDDSNNNGDQKDNNKTTPTFEFASIIISIIICLACIKFKRRVLF